MTTAVEPITINSLAQRYDAEPASLLRTVKRWPASKTRGGLFDSDQRAFVDRMGLDTEFPGWLQTIWENNYQPRGSKKSPRRPVSTQSQPKFNTRPRTVVKLSRKVVSPPAEWSAPIRRPMVDNDLIKLPPISVRSTPESGPLSTWREWSAVRLTVTLFSNYNIAKLALLGFQSFVFAVFAAYVIENKLQLMNLPYRVPFALLWVIGFFVDAAGFAIARKLPKPDASWKADERAWWLGGFFVFQIALDACFIFYESGNGFAITGQLLVFFAAAFSIAAYSRSDFKELFTKSTDK
jgi:hypothetical protein